MIKFLTKLKFSVRLNMKGIITNNFVEMLLKTLTKYYSKYNNYYNFLISLKIIDKNKDIILYTPFMPLTLKTLNHYLRRITDLLLDLNNLSNIKNIYFVAFKIPIIIDIIITDIPNNILTILPKSMNKLDWDLLIKEYDYLQILEFNTSESKGWIENKIILLDTKNKQKIIIYDVREINRDNESSSCLKIYTIFCSLLYSFIN